MNISSQTTKKELVDYLRTMHGVDLPDATRDELLAVASEKDGVDYATLADPASGAKRKGAAGTQALREIRSGKRVTVRVHSQDKPGGKDDVFVGVNGEFFLLKRDVDIDVPEAVYHALNNAVMDLYDQKPDGTLECRQVHQYPFSKVV